MLADPSIRGIQGPAPHRAGGLKYALRPRRVRGGVSRPPQGGWIEIALVDAGLARRHRSRPPQGGWIEIWNVMLLIFELLVPPPTGRVD